MNGLEIIDLKQSGITDRLFNRRPKENAFIEVQNLMASVPLYQLSFDSITSILNGYSTNRNEGKSRLLNIYSEVLSYFVRDKELSDDEVAQLQHLQTILGLTDEEAAYINTNVVYPYYERAVKIALLDKRLSEDEKIGLDKLALQLRIPQQATKAIYQKISQEIYQQAVNSALADRMLSPAEERELSELAQNLNVSVSSSHQTQQVLDRFRWFWRLSEGHFPELQTPIHLQRNEICAAYVPASHHEIRTVTKAIRYSGYSTSTKIMGVRFRSGSSRSHRVTQNVQHHLDSGTLYFTTKRLLMNGRMKTAQIPLTKIIGESFYSDGMLIEKDSGKDQIFLFNGDIEWIQAIFDSLMTYSRR